MLPSYSRIDIPGGKLYAPHCVINGHRFFLKGAQKTATEALKYSKKFVKKWNELHGKKEKVSGNQS